MQRWRANILNALEGALDIYTTGRGQHPQLEQAMSPRYQRWYAIIQERQTRPLAQESVAYWWALMVQLRETRALMDEGVGEYVIIHNVPALRTLTRMRDMQVVYLLTEPGFPTLRCVPANVAAAEALDLWSEVTMHYHMQWYDTLLNRASEYAWLGTGRQAYEPPPLKLFPRVRTADLYGMVPDLPTSDLVQYRVDYQALDAQENARHAPAYCATDAALTQKWWELSYVHDTYIPTKKKKQS